MIKLVDDLYEYNLNLFDDIFFHRISSDYSEISRFENVFFYVCENNGAITGVISKVDGVLTMSLNDNTDFEELSEFVKVIGFTTILCDEKYSCYFEGKKASGKIMKLRTDELFGSNAELLRTHDLKNVYPVLKRIFRKVPDFSEWFVNTCYGMIHNTIMAAGVRAAGEIVSVAFMLFVNDKKAVLSAVATQYEHRNRGYAMEIVKKLLDENRGKEIYLFLENPVIEKYYGELGFVPCGMWSEIENVL